MLILPGLARGFILGLITALCGVVFYLFPPMAELETDLGLKLLYKMRGQRTAPSNVVVVSIDRQSSQHFGYPNNPRYWPRSLHANLVTKLHAYGARVIVFDVLFSEKKDLQQDQAFTDALSAASNVVLFANLKLEPAQVPDAQGTVREILKEILIPPLPQFTQAAAAYAPFPLPKVPARVNQAWLFKTSAGDLPTLPVIALHYFASPVFEEFKHLIQRLYPDSPNISELLQDIDHKDSNISRSMRELRQYVQQQQELEARSFPRRLEYRSLDYTSAESLLNALLAMYQGSDSLYIDFYGPPRSITTIPYYQIISPGKQGFFDKAIPDFSSMAVFVGFSEQFQPEQKDGFNTVFSQQNGVDLSGVEIAATVFANMLEDRRIKPIPRPYDLILIFLWGVVLGLLLYLFPGIVSVLATVIMGMVYLFVADYWFTRDGTWFPMLHPLFFQLPFALLAALLWRYLETYKERQKIHEAVGYFLPSDVVDRLPKWSQKDLADTGRIVQGVCMVTDAERYTSLSETMEPSPLRQLLNRYYNLLFEPVKNHGGSVIDVVGDAMLAIWADGSDFFDMRDRACQTALAIRGRMNTAKNNQQIDIALPTRIGLHCGKMIIGNVGAGDHFEYRAVGDNINTASRIEGLNKYLGTRILASEQVVNGLDNLVTRRVGRFRLKGKGNWVEIYELLCLSELASDSTLELSTQFLDALFQFEAEQWQEAKSAFELILQRHGSDGPTHFYLQYCDRYLRDGSPRDWDGVITLAEK